MFIIPYLYNKYNETSLERQVLLDKNLTDRECRLLMIIMSYINLSKKVNNIDFCFAGIKQLSNDLGKTERPIQKILNELKDKGYIHIIYRKNNTNKIFLADTNFTPSKSTPLMSKSTPGNNVDESEKEDIHTKKEGCRNRHPIIKNHNKKKKEDSIISNKKEDVSINDINNYINKFADNEPDKYKHLIEKIKNKASERFNNNLNRKLSEKDKKIVFEGYLADEKINTFKELYQKGGEVCFS